MSELGVLHDVCLGIDLRQGIISYIGDIDGAWKSQKVSRHLTVHNADENVVMPGFVDSHTHLVFAGDRADEFYKRASGVSYADIAAAGGGIRRTMEATRLASEEELLALARSRYRQMLQNGTTAFECKSGYGLNVDSERLLMRVINTIAQETNTLFKRTYMGAHLVPPEFVDDRQGYVQQVATELEFMSGSDQCDFYDIFVDPLAFTQDEAQLIANRGRELGLRLKCHADEFGDDGTAAWAVINEAVSADHLGGIGEAGIAALAASGTIATLLPGTMFFSGHGKYAPARRMIDSGCAVALATDLNPGSSLLYSMPLVMTLAALKMQMNAAECITASTINAAHALGIAELTGSLEVGKRADFIVLDCKSPQDLAYHVGADLVRDVFVAGRYVKLNGVDHSGLRTT
jgi:imidazolonepropionase